MDVQKALSRRVSCFGAEVKQCQENKGVGGCVPCAALAAQVPAGFAVPFQGRGERGGGAVRGPAAAHHADRAQHGGSHRRAHRRRQPGAQPAGALHDRRGGG